MWEEGKKGESERVVPIGGVAQRPPRAIYLRPAQAIRTPSRKIPPKNFCVTSGRAATPGQCIATGRNRSNLDHEAQEAWTGPIKL